MDTVAVWAGLDLGHQRCSLCFVDDDGRVLDELECASETADVGKALSRFPVATIRLIAVEAGTNTYLVRSLREQGYPVGIFEARKTSKFLALRRNKTDASDAHGLADLARLGQHTVSQVHLKSVEFQQLRSELLLRHKLLRMRVAVEASIKSRLFAYGQRIPTLYSASGLHRSVEEAMTALLANDGVDLRGHLEPLLQVAENLRTYLKNLDIALEKRARAVPVCERFMEIPGVGWLCALSFYSAIEDPSRFASPSDVGRIWG